MGEDHPRMDHASNLRFDGKNVPVTRRDIKTCWSSPPKHVYLFQSPSILFFPFMIRRTIDIPVAFIYRSEKFPTTFRNTHALTSYVHRHGVNIKSMPELWNLGSSFGAKRNQTNDWECLDLVGDVVSLQFPRREVLPRDTSPQGLALFPNFLRIFMIHLNSKFASSALPRAGQSCASSFWWSIEPSKAGLHRRIFGVMHARMRLTKTRRERDRSSQLFHTVGSCLMPLGPVPRTSVADVGSKGILHLSMRSAVCRQPY
ncbi:hypothetical protein V8E51_004073 [Hyaloscypha variabilis]